MARQAHSQRPRKPGTHIAISLATVLGSLSLLFLPTRSGTAVACGLVFAVGLWSVMFPNELLEWALPTHSDIDPANEKLWWIPRVIGIGAMLIAALAVATLYQA